MVANLHLTIQTNTRFVNFYMGMGNMENERMYTPMIMESMIMPPVVSDDKYKVFRPQRVEKDEAGNVTAGMPTDIHAAIQAASSPRQTCTVRLFVKGKCMHIPT